MKYGKLADFKETDFGGDDFWSRVNYEFSHLNLEQKDNRETSKNVNNFILKDEDGDVNEYLDR